MRFSRLVSQPGLVLKVLKGELLDDPRRALDNEVKVALRLEMAGVQGTARVKYFTHDHCVSGHPTHNNAIFMVDAGG